MQRKCFFFTHCFYTANVKVDMDRSLSAVKFQVINGSKTLLISPRKESQALFSKVNCSADADDEVKNKAILVQHLEEYGTDYGKKRVKHCLLSIHLTVYILCVSRIFITRRIGSISIWFGCGFKNRSTYWTW